MLKKLVILLISIFVLSTVNASAQFGKNRVVNRKLDWQIYHTEHFGIRHYFDLKDPKQYENMRSLVALLESQYPWFGSAGVFDHEVKEELPVVVYETHSDLEGSSLADPFIPEGVGAFVEWAQVRMVAKADFDPQLLKRIVTHELAHQFQMKILKRGLKEMLNIASLPNGFIEGGAEYLTGLRLPHTRDDIRDRLMRMMASDIHNLPSWEDLVRDRANGYVAWKMVYDFLDAEFGPGTGIKFHVQAIKGEKDLGLSIYRLSKGKLGNPTKNTELFNQEFFNYYNDKYELDRASRPKPYQNTDNFKGRNVTPLEHPYPISSAVRCSSNGNQFAAFTYQKYGVALVTFPIPEEILYSEDINDKLTDRKAKFDEKKLNRDNGKKVIVNLTPQMVPVPYEYLLSPFEVWPKNGTHLACSSDGRIAFFARTGRDHMLYIIENKEGGKILHKIALDVNQGFSPSFSPDGKRIYFSAMSHAVADIYVIDLESREVTNLTDDYRYDTAPVVSPDGTQVVYVGNDGDFNHLFMLNLTDGSKKQITFNRYNDSSPSWSDDGTQIVFTSDQKDKIWNLYTLDLAQNTRTQWWIPFFGGIETPMYAFGVTDKVYLIVYRNDDTFHGQVYPNYEIFEEKLKAPVSVEPIVDNKESNVYSFNSDEFFDVQLDPNQTQVKTKPPEDWMFDGGDLYLGGNTIWGMFGRSYLSFTNFMETKRHMFQFASYGSFFRNIEYAYVNQENRLGKGLLVKYNSYPLYFDFYDFSEGRPDNFLIENARWNEKSVTVFGQYPFSKWTRVELFTGFRSVKYDLGGLTPEVFNEFEDLFSDTDKQLFRIMNRASGPSLPIGIAIVRDTVGSRSAHPFHGNALRAEVLVAPPLGGSSKKYVTASAEARVYRHLGASSLLALRGELKTTSRESGEIIVTGGADRFRGRDWGSVIGNQLVYGSVELRFPLVDALVFPGGFGIGPFRGLFFADAGVAKFSGENFPAQKITAYGAGIEFKPFQVIWARRNGKMVPNFYVTFGW